MIRLFSRPDKPIDWHARLAADVAMRKRFIGDDFGKRREAALKARKPRGAEA